MFILGLQGSPRLKGNTTTLLSAFLEEAKDLGADTRLIHVADKHIDPCREYTVCEKRGTCPIEDDMPRELYPLLRRADIVVAATPIFFYNCTAQLKALIDRCQTFWARKYRLKLKDPGSGTRRGYLLAVGATKGKNLFEGLQLTVSYFFDAIDARFEGSLTYPGIENRKDMEKHPSMKSDVRREVEKLLHPLMDRKKICFVCPDNSFYSQIAGAYAQARFGSRFDVSCGGMMPSDTIDPVMEAVMKETGIDMAFRTPRSLDTSIRSGTPDWLISLGDSDMPPVGSHAVSEHWHFPAYTDKPVDFIRNLRDDIRQKVETYMDNLNPR